MKKLILILILGLMAFPMFAQFEVPEEVTGMFETFAALVVGIPFVVEIVKRVFSPPEGLWTQIVSWGTGIFVTIVGGLFELGFLADLIYWQWILVGFLASLAANGVFDTQFPIWVLKKLGIIKG
jgi:hypothetical protein